jgi:hypothetical protein
MPSNAEHHDTRMRGELRRRAAPGARHRLPLARMAPVTAALVGLALMAAGCGGSNSPGSAGGGGGSAGGSSLDRFEAYARCMRSHGISDFPDPTTSPGGGVAIQLNGGPGSDLNKRNPRFNAANQVCRSLEPGGSGIPQQSAQKIAAEVRWARCMRSHGLPNFPDPNGQGAFDRSEFDESTPAFQSASKACQSLINVVGPIPVHP